MTAVRVHYPGRVCVLGEHCDWAGGASLAVPLPLGVGVTVERPGPGGDVAVEQSGSGEDVTLRTVLEGRPSETRFPVEGFVDRNGGPLRFAPAALHLLRAEGIVVGARVVTVDSDLPAGRGLSSSAAFSLAVLDGLARSAGHTVEPMRLAAWAFRVEHDLLGVECGLLDQLACAARAPVLIEWGSGRGAGHDLRTVPVRGDFHLLVGAFATPRDTAGILAALNRDVREGGAATAAAFPTFAASAREGAAALAAADPARLGAAMDRAQRAYEDHLEVALPELAAPGLRRACTASRAMGALGAKFSGAGGDGSVVALFGSAAAAAAAATALRPGLDTWSFRVGGARP